MSSNTWQRYKLGEIVDDIAMGPFGSNLKVDNFISEGVPVIRGGNLNEGGFEDENFVFVSEEKANSLKRSLAHPDDLVFTHRGTIGQVGIIPHDKYPKYLVSQSQMRLTVSRKYLEPKFLYYFFKSPIGQYELLKNASQVGVPAIASPTTALKEVEINLPPLLIQRRIADILSALDDKIQLNRQANATLETIAQSIFRQWFVEFNFPKSKGKMVETKLGMIPQGWHALPLDEVAEFLNGLALQKFPAEDEMEYLPVIKIRELKNGVSSSTDKASRNIPSKYIINDGDLIFSWSGTLEVKFWVGGEGALNQHLFKVTSNKYPLWFCYFWILEHLTNFRGIAEDKATTMGHIQRRHLSEALCYVPDNFLEMDEALKPFVDRMINLEQQSITLASIREALLPTLINGDIKI